LARSWAKFSQPPQKNSGIAGKQGHDLYIQRPAAMNQTPKTQIRGRRREDGFALVVTLTLMILLSVLVVGLLGLASVTLRSSTVGLNQAEARANARLALSLAIADLQKSMGPDKAASANASALDDGAAEPNILGAWESYHWAPTSSGAPSYSNKKNLFKRWLVSSPDRDSTAKVSFPSSGLNDPVVMMSDPSKKNSSDTYPEVTNGSKELRASRVTYSDDKSHGAFAYAVIDESQKAPVNLEEEDLSRGQLIANRSAPQRAKVEILTKDLDPSKISDFNKLVSYDSTILATGEGQGDYIAQNRNALTTYSIGLLTDNANGGLKKDLTALLEQGTVNDTVAVMGAKTPYGSSYNSTPGVPLWDYIRTHYQLYRTTGINSSNGLPKYAPTSTDFKATSATTQAGLSMTANTTPTRERLIPVISKFQLIFSVVAHNPSITERQDFLKTNGVGGTYLNYMAPHLVYDPVITLYNPYNVTLTFSSSNRLRIRVWDPPVVFGFKKGGVFLRPDWKDDGTNFSGMAQFKRDYQSMPTARKFFTLTLGGGTTENYAGAITLAPGETRVFSPRIQKAWTWGVETAGQYETVAFFDYKPDNSGDGGLGNTDKRSGNKSGLECINAWEDRAGLQTDHLANENTRKTDTAYSFEVGKQYSGSKSAVDKSGFVHYYKDERFEALTKAGRAFTGNASKPDFQVDMLVMNSTTNDYSALDTVAVTDVVRSYRFRFADPSAEVGYLGSSTSKVFSVEKKISEIYQANSDKSRGGKTPLGVLTMSMKTTVAPKDASKPWVYGNAVVEGTAQDTTAIGTAMDSYDLTYERLNLYTQFPGIDIDVKGRGYYGASITSADGVSNVPMFDVPVTPAASLGDLINANLVNTSILPRVMYPLGNSYASPLIPSGKAMNYAITATGNGPAKSSTLLIDHSYFLNDVLWDQTYFSTLLNYSTSQMLGGSDSADELMTKFLANETKLLNRRFVPAPGTHGTADEFKALSNQEKSKRAAEYIAVKGPFNVNSVSVDAWKAVLMSAQKDSVFGWSGTTMGTKSKVGYPRFQLPIAGDSDSSNTTASVDIAGQIRWAGFRTMNEDQIAVLAKEIVKEIQKRGSADSAPSETIGEFVNRRIGTEGGLHTSMGLIATAIQNSAINKDNFSNTLVSKDISTGSWLPTGINGNALNGLQNPSARIGATAEGAPPALSQGDIMKALAPVITVRGDTFVVRGYGESRNLKGEVIAKAWCEAVLQRVPQFVDPTDSVDTAIDQLKSTANKMFGRRFEILSFRWLSPKEV
jgi:hypothetical protein